MKLSAITVCVNYSDFLNHTVGQNRKHFDDFVVVTSPLDIPTIMFCEITCGLAMPNKIKVIKTNAFYKNNDKFNKGRAINVGLESIKESDWIIHLDADMVLPENTRSVIEKMILDTDTIYGTARYLCPSYESWNNYIITGKQEPKWYCQRRKKNIGVGYFQMFSTKASVLANQSIWYPEEYGHAGRSDRMFLRKWAKRANIKELIPIHLDSVGDAPLGVNWNGRTTPKFGP